MKNYLLITRGVVAFPNVSKKIIVGREYSIKTVNEAMLDFNKTILLVPQINPKLDVIRSINEIYTIGVLAKIIDVVKGNGELTLNVLPQSRVLINSLQINDEKKLVFADYIIINDQKILEEKIPESLSTLFQLLQRYDVKLSEKIKIFQASKTKENQPITSVLNLIYEITNELPIHFDQKQEILSLNTLKLKIDALCKMVTRPADASVVDKEVSRKVNETLNKQQREFYLREKMRVIKEELGEISSRENDVNSFKKRLLDNPYPKDLKEKLLQEINRLEASNIQESSMIRSYIEWILDLPWWQMTEDNNDIKKVKDVLNKSHYGLEKVKERIIEYLALRIKSKNSNAPIICLVGPPGVGKTSLVKSIAEALDKKFVKMALGGVYDESEIRGHRRTYLGSMPGRIIKAMKKAGVLNPVFLLDEIDKMASNQGRGDPACAMLEVLDPEQNNKFNDNYIEEDYDLSKVMFVATANYIDQIPEPLYDRLEIIELTSYSELEKMAIAKRYLIPKVLTDSGLSSKNVRFEDEAIKYIIRNYTKEAGVRELERAIRKICRKIVVEILSKKQNKTITKTIDLKQVRFYLGKEIFEYTCHEKETIPGIVNGMAYTQAGGDLLQIEVTHFPGKGEIKITGNLKETMHESAEVAIGFVKANAEKFGISQIDFKKIDLHIHVPSGGIPKDGPSAGVTLTTAILSALKNVPISNLLSMTGEITLRGKVLIIGGIKEKVISAFRGGVRNIIIPLSDERFLKDVPNEVLDEITIYLVENYSEIYSILFNKKVLKQTKVIKGKKVQKNK